MFYFVQPVPPIGGRSTGRGRHGSINPANGRERKRGGMRFSLALMSPESESEPPRRKAASGIARRVSHALRSPGVPAHTSAPAAGTQQVLHFGTAPAASAAATLAGRERRSAQVPERQPCSMLHSPGSRRLLGRLVGVRRHLGAGHELIIKCYHSRKPHSGCKRTKYRLRGFHQTGLPTAHTIPWRGAARIKPARLDCRPTSLSAQAAVPNS